MWIIGNNAHTGSIRFRCLCFAPKKLPVIAGVDLGFPGGEGKGGKANTEGHDIYGGL